MKLSSILCGVAAVALLATSAQAHGGRPGHGGGGGGGGNGGGSPTSPSNGAGPWGEYANVASNGNVSHPDQHNWNLANSRNDNVSRWAAKANVSGNIGDAGTKDGAKFSLQGKVTPHCVFYTGDTAYNGTMVFNLGNIGIYASENHNLATAFDQVDDAKFEFATNVAGCNTRNQVVLSSTKNALVSDYAFGYDRNEFTTEIPFSVTAKFNPVNATGGAQSTFAQTLSLSGNNTTAGSGTLYGAWKSPLSLTVSIDKASKSLVAGTYTGSFQVLIETK